MNESVPVSICVQAVCVQAVCVQAVSADSWTAAASCREWTIAKVEN